MLFRHRCWVSSAEGVPLIACTIAAMAHRIADTPISIHGLRTTNISTVKVSSRAANATMAVFQESRFIPTGIRENPQSS